MKKYMKSNIKPINNLHNINQTTTQTKTKTNILKHSFIHNHVLYDQEEENKEEEKKYKTNYFSNYFYNVFKKEIKNYIKYKKKHNIEENIYKINEDFFYKIPFIISENDIYIFKNFKNFFDILNIKLPTKEDFNYINENKPLKLKLSILSQLSFLQMFLYFYIKFSRNLTHITNINNSILIFNIYLLIFFILLFFNPIIFLSISLFKFIITEIVAFIFNQHTNLNFYKQFYNINLEVQHEFIEKSIYKESKKKFFFIANIIKLFNLFYFIKKTIKEILKKKIFIEHNNIYLSNEDLVLKIKKNWFFKFNFIKLIINIFTYINNKYIKEYFTQEKYDKLITNIDKLNFKINGFLYFYYKSEVEYIKNPEPLTIKKIKHLKDITYLYFGFYFIYLFLEFGFTYGFTPTDIMLTLLGVYDYIFNLIWELIKKINHVIVFNFFIKPIFYLFYNLFDTWYWIICTWPITILFSLFINYIINFLLLSFFYIKYFPRFFIEYFFTFYSNEDFKELIFNIHISYFYNKFDYTFSYLKLILNYLMPFILEFNINIDILYFFYNICIFLFFLIPIYIYIKFLKYIINIQLYINIFKNTKIICIKLKKLSIYIYNYILNYIKNKYFKDDFWTEDNFIEIFFEHVTYLIFLFWDHKNYFLILKKKKNDIIFQYYKIIHKSILFLDIFLIHFFDLFIFYIKFKIKDTLSKIFNFQYIYLILYHINKKIIYIIYFFIIYIYFFLIIPYIQNIYLYYILNYSYKFDKIFLFFILYIYNNFEIFLFLNLILYIFFYIININFKNLTQLKLKYYIYILIKNILIYILFIPIIPLGYIFFFIYLITKFYIYKNTKHLVNKYFRFYAKFQNFFILFTLIKFFSFYFILLNIYIFIYIFFCNIYFTSFILLLLKYIFFFFILNIYFYLAFLIIKIYFEIKIYFNILFFDEILKTKIYIKNKKTKILFNIYKKQQKIILFFIIILFLHIKYFFFTYIYNNLLYDDNNFLSDLEYETLLEEIDDEDEDEDDDF